MRGKKRILRLIISLVILAVLGFNIRPIGRLFYPLHYREHIFHYARKADLDPHLVAAVIYVESGFRPRVVSSEGAVGLMQIMPRTAAWVAPRAGMDPFDMEMLTEPETNIRLGTHYLGELKRQFGGSTVQALAAYNGGQGNVQRWLAEEKWDGQQPSIQRIPFRETREFVQKVTLVRHRYSWLYPEPD